jgi:hypothetical protein
MSCKITPETAEKEELRPCHWFHLENKPIGFLNITE